MDPSYADHSGENVETVALWIQVLLQNIFNNKMDTKMIITVSDYNRLMELMELTSFRTKMPVVTSELVERLDTAKMCLQNQIANDVITMNSRVKVKDLTTHREAEITITYPQDAEPREGRISVFSEIGLGLLGRKESDIVSWRVPGGIGRFQVQKVLYQPEAAGDYFL
jgi:regulator of nucleoside diphosphate kinase